MTEPPTTVDDYIAAQPESVRATLHEVRRRVLDAAPTAVESIRYGMPAYRLANGRPVYFASWQKHVSLHDIPVFDAELEPEVSPLRSGKDTVKFPYRHPVPFELITRVIEAIDRRVE